MEPTNPASPPAASTIRSASDLGALVRATRQAQALRQRDLAGLSGTGNRFIVDLERGKPTLQLQKVLDMIDLLGLEVVIRRKQGG
ncbi:type II toxin-antitoxin system Y4mF family antitoxin [Castellaniella caeni]|uniref:type II toxin-antitoxin system Y4mF family antitoxin n=1 Tax=Castellaniella caeni TaxID=266123 RepID=UPI000833B1D3|nr:type II toxin-antitoxin system Y4mF family antitoxin [Castellaniella caeni]